MFTQYNYFQSRLDKIPEVKTLSRITGITGMEELVKNIRSIEPVILAVEDDADGYLDLTQRNLDHGYHTFVVLDVAKVNNSEERIRALNTCMKTALKIFRMMMNDAVDFGDPCYGFNRSKIDYQRIGPLVNNTWGYLFTYELRNENFLLEEDPAIPNDPVP